MTIKFAFADAHGDLPSVSPPEGRVALSRLGRGESFIHCSTACIKYVHAGEERYEIDGRIQIVRPGQFLVVDAGVPVRAILSGADVAVGLCVYTPGDAAPIGEPENAHEMGRSFLVSGEAGGWRARLEAAVNLVNDRPENGPRMAQLLAARLKADLPSIISDIANQLDRVDAARSATRQRLVQQVQWLKAHLEDHDDRDYTLTELARMTGLSPFHLTRTFKAVYGVSVVSFHRTLRLKRVAKILRHEQISIVDAADLAGFSETSSFGRAFRKQFGCSPSAFLKQ